MIAASGFLFHLLRLCRYCFSHSFSLKVLSRMAPRQIGRDLAGMGNGKKKHNMNDVNDHDNMGTQRNLCVVDMEDA